MKKILSSVLAASMLASLAACGSSAPAQTTAAAAPAATQAAAPAAAAPAETTAAAAKDEKVNLKWALWDVSSTVYYQPLIDAYQAKNPNVTIEMVDLGSQDYSTVLGTQLSGSGCDFDIATIKDVPGYTTLVNKGVLESLNDRIKADSIDLGQYSGITDQVTIKDNLYELPFRSDIWVIYYNKDVFDKAGVPYPSNDMTWAQYDEIARKLTDTTPGAEVYGCHYHTWRSTVQLMGILDGKNSIVQGNYDFTKPYYEMVSKQQADGVCMDYATLKTQGLHYSDAFAQGNVGMLNMGSWFLSTVINKLASGEYTECANWGIVKYPHAEGVEPGSTLATITALALPVSAPHKDQAWDFIKFVTGAEGAEILAKTGNIPAMSNDNIVASIAAMEGFPQDENSKQALVTSHTYLEMPANDKASEIETVLNEQHDLIMTESASIDEAVAAMNTGVTAVIG